MPSPEEVLRALDGADSSGATVPYDYGDGVNRPNWAPSPNDSYGTADRG
jgi:hypothetical protein